MNTFERRNRIVDIVNASGSLMVSDISHKLGVTEVTIRSDLRFLEERRLLTRFHGGAARLIITSTETTQSGGEVTLSERYKLAVDPKKRIAIEAARLVSPGDTLILDSGSTTRLIADELVEMANITVITNSLPAATILAENNNITLVVCGGTLRHKTSSLHGSIAEYALKGVSADLMFVGADGLDCETGITTFNEGYAISSIMAALSHQVIVVADSSKFGRRGFNTVLPVTRIDKIITDKDAPVADIEALKKQGKQVILA